MGLVSADFIFDKILTPSINLSLIIVCNYLREYTAIPMEVNGCTIYLLGIGQNCYLPLSPLCCESRWVLQGSGDL